MKDIDAPNLKIKEKGVLIALAYYARRSWDHLTFGASWEALTEAWQ